MTKKNDFRWSEEQKNTEQDILEGRYSSVKDLSAEKDKLTQIVANNKARKQINIRIKN